MIKFAFNEDLVRQILTIKQKEPDVTGHQLVKRLKIPTSGIGVNQLIEGKTNLHLAPEMPRLINGEWVIVPPKLKKTKVTPDMVLEMLQRAMAGESSKSIAKSLDIDTSTVVNTIRGDYFRNIHPEHPRYLNGCWQSIAPINDSEIDNQVIEPIPRRISQSYLAYKGVTTHGYAALSECGKVVSVASTLVDQQRLATRWLVRRMTRAELNEAEPMCDACRFRGRCAATLAAPTDLAPAKNNG